MPYIKIPKVGLKFMIDAGSSKTLISPPIVEQFYRNYVKYAPFKIKTAHKITFHEYVAHIPLPKIFKTKEYFDFHIFEFNEE